MKNELRYIEAMQNAGHFSLCGNQDNKQILNSMLDSISSCVPNVKLDDLSTFDVDYIFTQVRAKSVGESATILSACVECNEENEVKIRKFPNTSWRFL